MVVTKSIHNPAAQCLVVVERDCLRFLPFVSTQLLPSIVASGSPHPLGFPPLTFYKLFFLGLSLILPIEVLAKIEGIIQPSDDVGLDMLAWDWSRNETFFIVETHKNYASGNWGGVELDSRCARYGVEVESNLHILRNCLPAKNFARQWLVGCTKTLGDILLFQAEARSMMEGLKLAQDRGYRKVEVENDNALLIESIYCGISEFNGLAEMQQLNLICNRE
ncbi:hypothetical protein Goklo_004739 [Gossypium klotzschianum]|uniref:RNase H type-1 domain-containing protein n=1 Tax=Gossypium klotzschianum TaxID=34286 RepID=A0A7J8VPU5_9ROSI|nr:hypothetical protein [Gossypium klotzschianum]